MPRFSESTLVQYVHRLQRPRLGRCQVAATKSVVLTPLLHKLRNIQHHKYPDKYGWSLLFCGTGINKIWCGSVCQKLFGNMFYPWYPRPKYTNPFFNCCYQVQPALHLGCLKLSLFQIIGYHLKKFVGFLSVGRNPGFAPVDMKNINQKHSGTWNFWWKKTSFTRLSSITGGSLVGWTSPQHQLSWWDPWLDQMPICWEPPLLKSKVAKIPSTIS